MAGYEAGGHDRELVEGTAEVVAINGDVVWLVPEQTTSCGGCAAASACGGKGIGTLASRLHARRFSLTTTAGLEVGERVVVGIHEGALLRASLTAYAIPLGTLLLAGAVAQGITGSDAVALAASVAGLLAGVALSRRRAGRLAERGDLAPRFVRRAGACQGFEERP